MEGNETTGKRKTFFRDLFERNHSAASEESATNEQAAQQDETPAQPETIETACIEAKGALLEAWHRWSPGGAPLALSLAGNGHGCKLPLTEREFGVERVRLSARIERDAKEYIRELDRMGEENLRIAAMETLAAAGEGDAEESQAKMEEAPVVKTMCRAYVSANGMAAWLLLFPPSDPNDVLDTTTIAAVMQEQGITTGIDSTALSYAAEQHPYFTLIPCACGTPVQEGENGRVVEHFARQLDKSVKIDERGVADYRAMTYMQMIKEGDVICDIIPSKPGVAGMRVDGVVTEPQPVQAATVPAGANTRLSEDGAQLLAAKDGHLKFEDNKFLVKQVLDIPGDVDYNTGNINYRGDVHIRGDVRGTFEVKATGNVTIDGLVEAATVEAGGDVLISCGVLGDNNALIKSRGNIRAKYLENCEVYARKSVFADCIIASQVYSDESIQVTSGHGTIIGGTLIAAQSIKARMVGTESGRQTKIELGTLVYAEHERGNDAAELKSALEELAQLERDIALLKKRQGKEGSNPRLAVAQLRKSSVCAKIDKLSKRRKELEEMKPDPSKCRFEASTVYPPTQLTISGAVWKFEDVKNRCVGFFDKETGEIKIS